MSKQRSDLYNPYVWLGIIGVVVFLIGGAMMVVGIGEGGIGNATAGGGVAILGVGIILMVVFVMWPEKKEKRGSPFSSWDDLSMHVRIIAENVQKEFENPVKIDVYKKDHRTASLFAPPSTITIYEEVDLSKKPEVPDTFAPRYTKLQKKKRNRINWRNSKPFFLMAVWMSGMVVGPAVLAYRMYYGITSDTYMPLTLMSPVYVGITFWSSMSWSIAGMSLVKRKNLLKGNNKGDVKMERRMLCAFRNEVPTRAALIIEDVCDKVEKYILIEFDQPSITYEKRISKEDMAFFKSRQRGFEDDDSSAPFPGR
jgi:hypothetical protein